MHEWVWMVSDQANIPGQYSATLKYEPNVITAACMQQVDCHTLLVSVQRHAIYLFLPNTLWRCDIK